MRPHDFMSNPANMHDASESSRREFLTRMGLAGAMAVVGGNAAGADTAPATTGSTGDRACWLGLMERMATPVLENIAKNQLIARMPVETAKDGNPASRKLCTHLEAFGRTLAGIGPWLELSDKTDAEKTLSSKLAGWALTGIDNATNTSAADHLNFASGGQPLVDAAFLAYGLVLAQKTLWYPLPSEVKERVIASLQVTRRITPPNSNWLLFSAMIEAFLARVGVEWKEDVIDTALSSHGTWYKGDGVYGDGPAFHGDYYNSYVIQPFLVTILRVMRVHTQRWQNIEKPVEQRALRYAAIQERLVAPDGTFPPLGRSIAYRCGAFHHLAHQAWREKLPEGLSPAQVRCALTAVIRRTLEARGTFDRNGWLAIGLAGHQPSLAESYISTGSLYLATLVMHPLGLSASHPFWSDPAMPWTQARLWSGDDLPADHAMKE
jgi:hypothetical protein